MKKDRLTWSSDYSYRCRVVLCAQLFKYRRLHSDLTLRPELFPSITTFPDLPNKKSSFLNAQHELQILLSMTVNLKLLQSF